MGTEIEAKLSVNGSPIEMKPFVEEFLAKTVAAAVSTLKGVEPMQSLEVSLKGGQVGIVLNGKALPLTPFPNDIIASMLAGMVSSLDLPDQIDALEIRMERR